MTTRLEKAARDGLLSRRSKLYHWMATHHDEFTAILKRIGRPNWAKLAALFGEMNLTNADGGLPSADLCKQTWHRVRKAQKARPIPQIQRTPDAPRSPSAGFEHDPNTPEDDIRRWFKGD